MSDNDLPRLWEAPGCRVVKGRWDAANNQVVADKGGPGGAPASLASERVLAKEWGGGDFQPACMAFLVDAAIAAELDAGALAEHLAALKAPPAPQLLAAVAGEPARVVFLTDTGANLAFRLEEWRFLGWEEACRVLLEVSRALAAAHAAGLVAGLVEPHHVHMGPDNAVLLALPGPQIALDARRKGLVQTPLLLAPELADGKPGPAADVHALAGLYLHLVCGRAPNPEDVAAARDGASLEALCFKVRGRDFDLPRRVLDLVAQLLHPEPDRRPRSVDLPELVHVASTGQLAQAVKLIHGDTDKVDLETGVPFEALKAPAQKPGFLVRMAGMAQPVPPPPTSNARDLPPPPGHPPVQKADSSFWEGSAPRSEPAPEVQTKPAGPLPTAAELRAQVQRQLQEQKDGPPPAPAEPHVDVGELPEGADRAAAEAFMRSLQAQSAPRPARPAPARGGGSIMPRLLAVFVIGGVLAYAYVRANLPAILDRVMPGASIMVPPPR